jgi:hypothetical protein
MNNIEPIPIKGHFHLFVIANYLINRTNYTHNPHGVVLRLKFDKWFKGAILKSINL